uniref:Uncharacterized protein n=1 Tax=Anguilla anguilla TaxID=7936 RepID=A0A0E9V829_ANGAN
MCCSFFIWFFRFFCSFFCLRGLPFPQREVCINYTEK